ncbi:unnamed protein product [Auanema sp. JU1783]|nr:unnamed protein product [Auanema sp. JU1783]
MLDYPVVFRCAECATESPTLDHLESHIWSRHLRSFPYKCSICSYPAINHSGLVAHFQTEHHTCRHIEFKRKVSDEVKLRDIVAASIVVPIYDDDDEHIFDQNQESQSLEEVHDTVVLEDNTIAMEDINVGNHMIPTHINDQTNEDNVIFMGMKEEFGKVDIQMVEATEEQILDLQDNLQGHNTLNMPVIEETGDLIDGDDESSYAVYSGHDLLDEAYEYIDQDGNTVYVTDHYPATSKSQRNMRLRVLKDRHMDMVVNRVANIGKRRRGSTVWECPECGKIVKYPSRIEEHRRSHTGEKPHQCEECGQKFSQKGALKCHMRLHSGERPYPCTWECGKSFVSASAQRMHEKQHSGERPFKCRVCGRLFGKRSHLIRHEQTIHRVETIDPRRILARGLDAAGDHEPTLKGIVEGVLQEVRQERFEKNLKKE